MSTLITVGGSAILLLLIGGAGVMSSRDYRARETPPGFAPARWA